MRLLPHLGVNEAAEHVQSPRREQIVHRSGQIDAKQQLPTCAATLCMQGDFTRAGRSLLINDC